MGTVSNRVYGWLLHVLDNASLSETDWLAGRPVTPESLHEPGGTIEWELFTDLCRSFESQFPSREALLGATRSYARERFAAEASELPGGFSDQRQLYWLAQNWLRPLLFPDFSGSYEQLADGRLQLFLAGPPDGSAPTVLFEMIQALLVHAPLLVGQSATRVDAEFAEGRATYTIVPSGHAEADLRERETLYRRLAEHASDIILELDDAGIATYISPNSLELLGYPSSELLGLCVFDFLHADDGGSGNRRMSEYLEDRETNANFRRVRHRDGSWRWFHINTRRTQWPDSAERFILVARDVTEQRIAQEAVRISEERYRIVSELTSHYAFSVRIDADQSTVCEWLTEAFSAITGYEPEEINPQQWTTLVHSDDHDLRRRQFAEAIRSGRSSHEYRIRRKSGEIRMMREHTRVIRNPDGSMHWYGACRDITEQKTAESERALTQERFNAITQSSHDVIVEYDSKGNILYVSPNVEGLFGHRPEDVITMRQHEFIHPDDLPVLGERLNKLMEGWQSEDLIFRVRNSADEWRWVETSATAFRTVAGEVRTVMISRDISDRLEMEEERRRLVSVVENSSEFIAMIADDGRILFLNDAGQRMIGLDDDPAVRSRTIFDCFAPEDSQDMRFKIVPAVARTGHWDGDLQLRNVATGERIATLAHVFQVARARHGRDRVMAIVARDITERITGERLLRESEARHRMLVESAYDLIAEFDLHGCYVYLSPNFGRQLGYAAEELLTTCWLDQVHPDDRTCAQTTLLDLSRHSTHACPPLRMRHSDGRWVWVETNLKKYENFQGEPLVLAFFRDITRRKNAEEALERSREELLQSQKMEAIGRLAGGVAHDFNNLLTTIIGYSNLLLEEVADKSGLRSDAEQIIRAANRAADLTRQLLAFSRRQVLLPKVLDLNSLVSDVDRLLQRLIGEDIEFVTRLEGDRAHVKLDPGQLEQLVINLAVNARDAMPRGGRLTISTENLVIPSKGAPAHPGIASGRYVLLTVEDTGIGMDVETLSKIFEPFFTTKGASKGTGLGLATVYGIIQQSGGEIRVASELGDGATFTVYLPRVDEDVDPPEPAHVDFEGKLRGDETILLVEDSETVRSLVKRYLEKHGYQVIDAPSGADALRSARSHDGEIALLVTDVVLPKMDGHALAQRLAQLRPETKVLYMSGFSDDALSHNGVVAGDIALLQKPFAPPTLLREVRRILGDPQPPAS